MKTLAIMCLGIIGLNIAYHASIHPEHEKYALFIAYFVGVVQVILNYEWGSK